MASETSLLQQCKQCSNQPSDTQDDDAIWLECINMASIDDPRLIDGWTKITDVTLVYVALFTGVLTAFIVQTSRDSDFRPHSQVLTNQLLIAIYLHQLNPSTPIDVEKFLRLDESKSKQTAFLNSLLYTSLAISVAVGAVAMAAKLWIIRYKHEVNTSGPPHLRARRRQEVYDGSISWGLEKCIEALPVMALISEVLFGLFIFSSISEDNQKLGYVVGIILHLGLSFILVTSFTAAFNSTSPFRSPFSDFVNFIFRIFPDQNNSSPILDSLLRKIGIRPRTITIMLTSILVLAVTGYLASKQIAGGVPLIYFPLAAIFALSREETEMDTKPRLYNLPKWATFTSCILFITCALAFYYSNNLTLFTIFYLLMCTLLGVLGFVIIKTSRIKPKTADADAIAWLLSTSLSQNPDWFKKAVQIAEGSSNLRARLLKALFPLLVPLIISDHRKGDEKTYLNCLADLVDFEPCNAAFWRNEASLEYPSLPPKLREKLEGLVRIGGRCPHRFQNADKKLWVDDTARCPEECASNAAEHILRMLGKDEIKQNVRTMEDA